MSTRDPTTDGSPPPPGRRREPQQGRSRARLERVLSATTELVVERGPEEATMALIAERAGVSVAWIYRYFDNRQALFDSIVLDAVHRLFEKTQEASLAAVDGDWRDGVWAVLGANVDFYAREPAFARLWNSEFRSREMLVSNRIHDDDQAAWIYETMTAQGLLRPGPATERACRLLVAFSDRGLELAFTYDDQGDPIIVQQLGDALVALIEPFVTDTAVGPHRRQRPRSDR
jgi:AcrR family transcriptional regulator